MQEDTAFFAVVPLRHTFSPSSSSLSHLLYPLAVARRVTVHLVVIFGFVALFFVRSLPPVLSILVSHFMVMSTFGNFPLIVLQCSS